MKKIIKKKTKETDLLSYSKIKTFFLQKMGKSKKMEMYSNILINILFLHCRYSESTELVIKDFLKKYKKEINKVINKEINQSIFNNFKPLHI
jgi:hypothetical protein